VVGTPDGGCWVTLWAAGSAVRLDASGAVVDQVAFGKGTEAHGLTVTLDGNLWVALETGALAYVHS
jgi:virginiamycin B lyase